MPAQPPIGCTRTRRTSTLAGASYTELLQRAQVDDRRAWAEIVRRLSPMVRQRIGSANLARSAAEDAFQMTWLKLARSLDTIRDPERLPGWLGVTARNEALNVLRNERRATPSESMDHFESEDPDHDGPMVSQEVASAIDAAVATLTDRQRAVVQIRYLDPEPLSYSEMADRLGMQPGAIGPTLGRALKRMGAHPAVLALR